MKKCAMIFVCLSLLMGTTQFLFSMDEKPEVLKEIVKIKYMNAHEAQNVLRQYMSPKGKLQVIHSENRLVIEDIPEIMEKIHSILKGVLLKTDLNL